MFRSIVNIYFITSVLLTNVIEIESYDMTDKLIVELGKEDNIKSWIDENNHNNKEELEILSKLIFLVATILTEINTEPSSDLKTMILKTELHSQKEISFPFFESYIIVRSIQRIYEAGDKFKSDRKLISANIGEDYLKYIILYSEYDCIFQDFTDIMTIVDSKLVCNYFKRKLLSRCMLNDVLPTSSLLPVRVSMSNNKVTNSLKIQLYHTNSQAIGKEAPICSNEVLQNFDMPTIKRTQNSEINLEDLMFKTYVYSEYTTKLMISLSHFHSLCSSTDNFYEVNVTKDNKFEFRLFCFNPKSLDDICNYIAVKDVPSLEIQHLSNTVDLIHDYSSKYSRRCASLTEKMNIEHIRIVVLSCGHQMGVKLCALKVKDFIERRTTGLDCPNCGKVITIIGSFTANLYKCFDTSEKSN